MLMMLLAIACSDDEDTGGGHDVISTLLQSASHNRAEHDAASVQNGRVRISDEYRPLVQVLALLRTDQKFDLCLRHAAAF